MSRTIKYKRVSVPMPHCSECDQQLFGNGSIASPYECKCGVWGGSWEDGEYVWTIVGERKDPPKEIQA